MRSSGDGDPNINLIGGTDNRRIFPCDSGAHEHKRKVLAICRYRAFSQSDDLAVHLRADRCWFIALSCTVSQHDGFSCQRDMIPTPSSFKEETCTSSSLFWRLLSHEVPRHLDEDFYGRT